MEQARSDRARDRQEEAWEEEAEEAEWAATVRVPVRQGIVCVLNVTQAYRIRRGCPAIT